MNLFPVLAAGFAISGALVAYTDFRSRRVYDEAWIPAFVSLVWFWSHFDLVFVGLTSLFPILAVGVFWTANRLLKQKTGQGDLMAIAMSGLWPVVGLPAIISGIVVGGVGWKLDIWHRGGRSIPLAGLIGLALLVFSVVVLF